MTTIIVGTDLYGVSKKGKIGWDKIDSVKNSIAPILNQMPCMSCGRLSEELSWVVIGADSFMGGYRGVLSFCPHCHEQIQYKETLHYISNRSEII